MRGMAEVISSKGCSKMYSDISCTTGTNSFRDLQPPRTSSLLRSTSNSPFSGLVICVTGLSKEARKQVRDATERLGGQFSPHFHPQCTHLVVQSSHELKSEHASKHGAKDGLFVVTLGWFVDSVRKRVRLDESLYGVKNLKENYMAKDDINTIGNMKSCLHLAILDNVKQSNMIQRSILDLEEQKRTKDSVFTGQTIYVDPDVSTELRNKVVETIQEKGGILVNQWLVGQDATHVVCEISSVNKYLGHSNNLVTPMWVLKKRPQRLVHLSADLAHHVDMVIKNVNIPGDNHPKDSDMVHGYRDKQNRIIKPCLKKNQSTAILAKEGVRNRRGHNKAIKPSTPRTLLDSITWIMSEPPSTAYIIGESLGIDDDANKSTREPDACFVNFLQPLSEREKTELTFGNHFITILFPVDRFGEMGPYSRTFFSNTGFTSLQLLHHIYTFYQENMSRSEIHLAIHTDSRHADCLRSIYSSKEVVEVKRIDFLGSRKNFQRLKRVHEAHNKNIYELLTRS